MGVMLILSPACSTVNMVQLWEGIIIHDVYRRVLFVVARIITVNSVATIYSIDKFEYELVIGHVHTIGFALVLVLGVCYWRSERTGTIAQVWKAMLIQFVLQMGRD